MTTCLSLKTFKHNRLGYFCRVCRSYACRKSLKKTKPRNYAFEQLFTCIISFKNNKIHNQYFQIIFRFLLRVGWDSKKVRVETEKFCNHWGKDEDIYPENTGTLGQWIWGCCSSCLFIGMFGCMAEIWSSVVSMTGCLSIWNQPWRVRGQKFQVREVGEEIMNDYHFGILTDEIELLLLTEVRKVEKMFKSKLKLLLDTMFSCSQFLSGYPRGGIRSHLLAT